MPAIVSIEYGHDFYMESTLQATKLVEQLSKAKAVRHRGGQYYFVDQNEEHFDIHYEVSMKVVSKKPNKSQLALTGPTE